jgi:hypothetical protein
MQLFISWLILRILTSFFAAVFSTYRPLSALEQATLLWPPSQPVQTWLERVLVAPWLRWDAEWYLRIVTHGYNSQDGTAAFHPLYPWLATILYRSGVDPLVSLWIIASIASLILFYVYHKLACLDLNDSDAYFSTMLLFFTPVALTLFAPYTEPLFLIWGILCLFWARKGSWWLAGLAGGLAVLTRQQGLFLIVPLAWELWQAANYNLRRALRQWRDWLSLILIPFSMALWLAYRVLVLNDSNIDLSSINAAIYSILISPSASKVASIQGFIAPWRAMWLAAEKLILSPDPDIWADMLLGICFLVLIVISWKNMRVSYKLYTLVITLVSFSCYTGPVHPYMGLPRHLLLAFPVFISAAPSIRNPKLRIMLLATSLAGFVYLLLLYVLKAWVP